MKRPITTQGSATWWVNAPGDKYLVTGVDTAGKRFKKTFDNWFSAKAINVYRGSRWLLRGGRRWLIQRIYN